MGPPKFLTYKNYNEADESGIVECKDNLQSQKGIYVDSRGGGGGSSKNNLVKIDRNVQQRGDDMKELAKGSPIAT